MWTSRRHTKGARGCRHMTHTYNLSIILNYLYLQFFLIIFLTNNPNPPCQLSLWEELGENPRLSVECWQTLPTCDQRLDTGIEPMTSVVGGRRYDDFATEAPKVDLKKRNCIVQLVLCACLEFPYRNNHSVGVSKNWELCNLFNLFFNPTNHH